MASFAGFDKEMNASLESTFFPRNETVQTDENKTLPFQRVSQDSDSEDEVLFQIESETVNTHDLANEYFTAQLPLDNAANNEENENEASVFASTDPDAILLNEKIRSGCACKNKNCYQNFDSDVIIEHRLTMREFDKPEKESYLLGKLDQCSVKSKKRCKHNEWERQKFKYSFLTGTQLLIVIIDATWNVNACHYEVSYASASSLRMRRSTSSVLGR